MLTYMLINSISVFVRFFFLLLAESVFGCLHTMLGLVCKQLDFRFNTLSTVGLSQDGLYWRDELTIIKFMIDQGLGAIHHKNRNSDKVLYCFALAHIPLSSLDWIKERNFVTVAYHANNFCHVFVCFFFHWRCLGLFCRQLDFKFNTMLTMGPSRDGLFWRDECHNNQT